MVKVKPQAQITANYIASTNQVPQKYQQGVQGAEWQAAAASEQAEANYAAGVQEAASNKSRQTGINKVSNQAWQSAAANKGATRIAQGMRDGAAKQAQNWAPFRSVIEGIDLPARTRDAAANVQNRVLPLAVALQEAKKAQQGA